MNRLIILLYFIFISSNINTKLIIKNKHSLRKLKDSEPKTDNENKKSTGSESGSGSKSGLKISITPNYVDLLNNKIINMIFAIIFVVFSLSILFIFKKKEILDNLLLILGNLFAGYILASFTFGVFFSSTEKKKLIFGIIYGGFGLILFCLSKFVRILSIISSIVLDYSIIVPLLIKLFGTNLNDFIILGIFAGIEVVYLIWIFKKVKIEELVKFSMISGLTLAGVFHLIENNSSFIYKSTFSSNAIIVCSSYFLLIIYQIFFYEKFNMNK